MATESAQRRERARPVERPRLVLREPTEDEPANPHYAGVGAGLRQVRRQAGLSIDDVAQRTRLQRRYLKAIEDGDFEGLPGRSYALGFIRSYAEFLGLDGSHAVEAYKAEIGAPPTSTKLVFPSPSVEQRTPRGWLILVAFLAAAGVYGWWYSQQERGIARQEAVAPVPERLQAPPVAPPVAEVRRVEPVRTEAPTNEPPRPAEPAAGPSTVPPTAAPQVAVPAPPAAAAPPASAQTAAPAPPAAGIDPPAPPPLPAAAAGARPGRVYGAEGEVRVVIKANRLAWVRIGNAQGQRLFERNLEPGEVYRVPNQTDLTMMVGNVGGIEISVDGRTLPPLGPQGVAKGNISLNPTSLLEKHGGPN